MLFNNHYNGLPKYSQEAINKISSIWLQFFTDKTAPKPNRKIYSKLLTNPKINDKIKYNFGFAKILLQVMFMYSIKRHIAPIIERRAKNSKAILLTGSRQVGKSTLFKHLFGSVNQVTFDDDLLLAQATESDHGFRV